MRTADNGGNFVWAFVLDLLLFLASLRGVQPNTACQIRPLKRARSRYVITTASSIKSANPTRWNHASSSCLEGFLRIASAAKKISLPPSSAGNGRMLMMARLKERMAIKITACANPRSSASPVAMAMATGPPRLSPGPSPRHKSCRMPLNASVIRLR